MPAIIGCLPAEWGNQSTNRTLPTWAYCVQRRLPLIELILLGESEKRGAVSDWRYLHNGSIMHIDL